MALSFFLVTLALSTPFPISSISQDVQKRSTNEPSPILHHYFDPYIRSLRDKMGNPDEIRDSVEASFNGAREYAQDFVEKMSDPLEASWNYFARFFHKREKRSPQIFWMPGLVVPRFRPRPRHRPGRYRRSPQSFWRSRRLRAQRNRARYNRRFHGLVKRSPVINPMDGSFINPIAGFRRIFAPGNDPYVPNIPYVVWNQGTPRMTPYAAVQSHSGIDPRAVVYRNGYGRYK